MSTLKTLSKFYYGTTVTTQNRSIDFSEGGPEIQATLKVGSYTATEYAAEWQRALREAGTRAYTCSFNRTTAKLSVTSPSGPFSLLSNTGSRAGTSAWTMSGFTTASDKTGSLTYTGTNIVGSVYYPQYILEKYSNPDHVIVKEGASVNITPQGTVTQISFGDGTRITMNMILITDITTITNKNFVPNANGISEFMTFMRFLLTKGLVEFMPDKDTPATFYKVFLEGTADDRQAAKFKLKNMKVPDIYETGELTFRKVLV